MVLVYIAQGNTTGRNKDTCPDERETKTKIDCRYGSRTGWDPANRSYRRDVRAKQNAAIKYTHIQKVHRGSWRVVRRMTPEPSVILRASSRSPHRSGSHPYAKGPRSPLRPPLGNFSRLSPERAGYELRVAGEWKQTTTRGNRTAGVASAHRSGWILFPHPNGGGIHV